MFSGFWNSANLPVDGHALVFPGAVTTWGELRQVVVDSHRQLLPLERSRIGLHFVPAPSSYALLLACASLAVDLFVLDGSLSEPQCLELARELKLKAVISPSVHSSRSPATTQQLPGAADCSGTSTVTILTSGSTGRPKAVRHSWASLLRPVRHNGQSGARWLQAYRPHLYAGIQVVLQCLSNFGALCIPDSGWNPEEIAVFLASTQTQYVSATPSYWRRLLLFSSPDLLRRTSLRQITLGGEAVDQPILDALIASFPRARVVHIYATTELGRCFSVSDGRAGFPKRFLDAPSPSDAVLKIQDGELFAKSPNAMKCYDASVSSYPTFSEWIATGDLVSPVGERVYFTGRKNEMINVGGNKVYPLEVERVVRKVPGVADVRVYGRSSSVSGQLVSCEIVSTADFDHETVKSAVQQACSTGLLPHQRPRFITLVDRIELSTAYKTLRSGHP